MDIAAELMADAIIKLFKIGIKVLVCMPFIILILVVFIIAMREQERLKREQEQLEQERIRQDWLRREEERRKQEIAQEIKHKEREKQIKKEQEKARRIHLVSVFTEKKDEIINELNLIASRVKDDNGNASLAIAELYNLFGVENSEIPEPFWEYEDVLNDYLSNRLGIKKELEFGCYDGIWMSKDELYPEKEVDILKKHIEDTILEIVVYCEKQVIVDYSKVLQKRKDYVSAVVLYNTLSSKGDSYGQNELGECYRDFVGVEHRDYDRAFSLFCMSAQQNNIYALSNLGELFEYGNGTKINYQKAGDCYQKVIDLIGDKDTYCDGYCNYNICRFKEWNVRELDNLYMKHKWDRKKYSPDSIISNSQNAIIIDDAFIRLIDENKKHIDELYDEGKYSDALTKANIIFEQFCNKLVSHYCPEYHNNTLLEKIVRLKELAAIGSKLADGMHYVRKIRNRILHNDEGEPLTEEEFQNARQCVDDIIAEIKSEYSTR